MQEKTYVLFVEGMSEVAILPCLLPFTFNFPKDNITKTENKYKPKFYKQIAIKTSEVETILFLLICLNGKDKLEDTFKVMLDKLDLDSIVSIGIVTDADEDYQKSYDEISAIIKKYDNKLINFLSKKKYPSHEDNIITNVVEDKSYKLGLFVVPNKEEKGSIETLFLKAFKDSDRLKCLEEYMKCSNLDSEIEKLIKEFFKQLYEI